MTMEDPRKRAAEEKKLRIDHSDVYLENDKLAEKLEFSLEDLTKRRHRQVLSRDHEIKQIRQDLSNMQVTKTGALSPATSLRPQTCAATPLHPQQSSQDPTNPAPNPDPAPSSSSSPFFRRLKPPPVIVKLNVHMPHNSKDESSDVGSNVGDHAADDDGDTSDEEKRARERWRKQQQRRWGGKTVAWGAPGSRPSSGARGGGSAKERPAQDVKRVTRQQILLHNLDMEAIPASWYTKVHQPSDVIVRRRVSSAHPSSRPAHAAATSSTTVKRPSSETPKPRHRRTKSALPTASFSSESEIFCGGDQQQHQQQEQLKSEALRSRRQLMELAEGRGHQGGGGAGAGDGGGVSRYRISSNRLKFLEAVRMERERLDHRVRQFLESCDRVGKGGVTASTNSGRNRRTAEIHNILLPQTLYG